MDIFQLFSLAAVVFFGSFCILISLKEEKSKKEIESLKESLKSRNENLIKSHQNILVQKEDSDQEESIHLIIHELRAPLAVVKNAAELLLTDKNTSEDDKINFFNLIDRQAKKMLELVSTILDAAKLKAGKFSLEKKQSDLIKTISDTTSTFKPQAKTRNIDLKLNLDQDLPAVSFDPLRIEEVVSNLLSNSLKFTSQGGKIEISATSKNAPPGYVVVSVADTGIGISKERQQNIFFKFSQSRSATGSSRDFTTQDGSGLGLYIVKGIVEAHGGDVFLQSEENKGTTISFTLPINQNSSVSESSSAPSTSGFPNATLPN